MPASLLSADGWRHIDAAFGVGYTPFTTESPAHSGYERMYFKIMAGAATEPQRPEQTAQSLA